jgi:hypothetical protein
MPKNPLYSLNMYRRLVAALMIFSLVSATSYGQVTSSLFISGNGSEFWVGKDQGKPLITINLISGVKSPGVYHIPIDTNLTQLIAYAGGAKSNAILSEINVRRIADKDVIEFYQYDFDKLLRSGAKMPQLMDRDSVEIPESLALEKTSQILAIAGPVTSLILSFIILSKDD